MTEQLIVNHLSTLALAVQNKSASGRGSGKKIDLYGIKKLRELILELAVRGKLVAQNPEDEPASKLLERIVVEKTRLVREKQIKKQKAVPSIADDEKPFVLPNGWEWARLSDIGRDWGQKTPDQDFTYIDVGSINKEWGIISEPSVLSATEAPSRARKVVKEGTVIYSNVRPYLLNIAVVNQSFSPDPIASTAFAILHPLGGMEASYIYRYLRSPCFVQYVEGCQTGIAYPAINDKQFFSGLIAVPPEAEQHRIVTKVDELMALCDQIEQQTEASLSAHTTLVENLLATLTSSANAEELKQNWQRIASHFTTLFTTEASIDQLKQTILQLAVMGKLVPQDPNDEPAAKLLERIAAEKAQLVKEGKIKKQKPQLPVAEDDKPFELPNGWNFIRLGTLLKKITDGTHHSPPNGEVGEYLYISAKNIKPEGIQLGNATFVSQEVHDEIYNRCDPEKGDVLYIKDGATTGIATINDLEEPFSMLSSVALLKCPSGVLNRFLLLSMRAPYFYLEMRSGMTGVAITRVTLKKLGDAFIALPPESEQHRIVTKVNQLTTLCDQIKTHLQHQQQTRLHLADAMVDQVLNPTTLCGTA